MFGEKVVRVFDKIGFELIYCSGFYVIPLSLIKLRYESPRMYKLDAKLSGFSVAFSFSEF